MSRRDVVVFSLESWDDVWRRNQYLLDGLLRRDPDLHVLLVEPPSDPVHSALHAHRRGVRRGRGLRSVPGYDGRLHTLQATKWLPRLVGPVADRRLAAGVRTAARGLGMTSPVLWVNDPDWAHIVDGTTPAIYDITDDWVEAVRSSRAHTRIVANEARLMDLCAVVVVCSPVLFARKEAVRPVELIQNGVDVAAYRAPHARPGDLPERSALYLGTLHEDRLDVDLCRRLGERLALVDAHLVLVGPNALSPAHTAALAQTPGVTLLGPRPHEEVSGYLQHADVLVVPHVVDAFTDSLDPIKLYEYEAVGRPIAATPVAGFRELVGVDGVVIAAAGELPDRIADLVVTPPESVGPFEAQDWSLRVAAMDDVLLRASRR